MARRTVSAEPAFLLRRYPFKAHSALLDFLTREHGIVRLVCMSSTRMGGKMRFRPQLGSQCLLDWREGRRTAGLANLDRALPAPAIDSYTYTPAPAQTLLPVSYMNELVLRFFKPHDAHTELYDSYGLVAQSLATLPVEPLLRFFEWRVLAAAGFGGSPDAHDAVSPPSDRDGQVGPAVSAWLRDCKRVDCRANAHSSHAVAKGALEVLSAQFSVLTRRDKLDMRAHLSGLIDVCIGVDTLKTRQAFRQVSEFNRSVRQ
ncbi:MAG: recombination protein O N-terminal domain-containing protein [Gammaproteobacteria bacterium]|nr:recombination protein O N-terminal domain-containing protein [Gammaproteobacteria bacterium]